MQVKNDLEITNQRREIAEEKLPQTAHQKAAFLHVCCFVLWLRDEASVVGRLLCLRLLLFWSIQSEVQSVKTSCTDSDAGEDPGMDKGPRQKKIPDPGEIRNSFPPV